MSHSTSKSSISFQLTLHLAKNIAHSFSLPPSITAAPLPVGKSRSTAPPPPRNKKRKTTHIQGYGADDTPKAFTRLMALQPGSKRRSALDNGGSTPKSKKKKGKQPPVSQQKTDLAVATAAAEAEQEKEETPNSESQPHLKILPGESLSAFRQRVTQALPLSGIARNSSGNKTPGLSDHRITKHERRLKRLQQGWRKEEARLREKEQEERELAEEEEEDDEVKDLWEDRTADISNGKKKNKKGKKRKVLVVGEVDDGQADEWEALRKKREERKGLHDVVQAPPAFAKVPREVFKVKEGARVEVGNVPGRVGSLRRREEVGRERMGIIETYRKLMAQKRGGEVDI